MIAFSTTGAQPKWSFENVVHRVILDTEKQFIVHIQIACGKHFEAMQQQGREETMTLIKGNGILENGTESKEISPISLVKLVANKAYRIFNNTKVAIHLCFISTPSTNTSEEFYLRHKDKCYEIKTGNGERIYELFGVYGNGPSLSHSVALVEIEKGGASHPHIHPAVEESYVMIDGAAKLVVGEKDSFPKPEEVAVIPVGSRHQISNIGDGVLRFLALVTPPWTKECAIYEVNT